MATKLDRQNTLPAGTSNASAGTVALTRSGRDRREHGVFNQTELIHNFTTAGLKHELLYGLELGQQNKDELARSSGTVATVDLWRPVLPVVPLDGGGAISGSTLNRFLTRALYAQDQVSLSPHWKLLAGLRYDNFGQKTDKRLAGQSDFERTDIKTANPARPTQLIPIGTQRTRGLELSLAGELRAGTQATLSYAYLDARVTRSNAVEAGQPVQGKRATITPRNALSAWLTQRLGQAWTVGGGVNYVGQRFANPGNTVTLPSYAVVDAMLQYRLATATTVQLNLRNLFDRRYIIAGHGASQNLNLPGAPRNVALTLRHSF